MLESVGEDPIRQAAGDANLYRYVGNGATNATDPSGLYLIINDGNITQWKAFFQILNIGVEFKFIDGDRIAVIPKDPSAVDERLARDDDRRRQGSRDVLDGFTRRILESLIFFNIDTYIGTNSNGSLRHSNGESFETSERAFIYGELIRMEEGARFLHGENARLNGGTSIRATCTPMTRTTAEMNEYKRLLKRDQVYLQDTLNRIIAKG